MIQLQTTDIEGKKTTFGHAQDEFMKYDCVLGGHWEYDGGCFDSILWREGGETIYLRMPFHVLSGALDQSGAHIEFEQPYVIKHVVNVGLDRDENSLLTAAGFSQFQEPLDKDGQIKNKNKWEEAGEQMVKSLTEKIIYQ